MKGPSLDNQWTSETQEVGFGILLVASSRARLQGIVSPIRPGPSRPAAGTANVLVDNNLVGEAEASRPSFIPRFTCSQNRVEDMRHWGILSLVGFAKCAMTENRVLNCGYQQAPSIGIGASRQLWD